MNNSVLVTFIVSENSLQSNIETKTKIVKFEEVVYLILLFDGFIRLERPFLSSFVLLTVGNSVFFIWLKLLYCLKSDGWSIRLSDASIKVACFASTLCSWNQGFLYFFPPIRSLAEPIKHTNSVSLWLDIPTISLVAVFCQLPIAKLYSFLLTYAWFLHQNFKNYSAYTVLPIVVL